MPFKIFRFQYPQLNHDEIMDVFRVFYTGYPPLSGYYWAERKQIAVFPNVSVITQFLWITHDEALHGKKKQNVDWSIFGDHMHKEIAITLLEELLHSAQKHKAVSKEEKKSFVIYKKNREDQVNEYLTDSALLDLAAQAVTVKQIIPDEALMRILNVAREMQF